jgi:hypothetical protein
MNEVSKNVFRDSGASKYKALEQSAQSNSSNGSSLANEIFNNIFPKSFDETQKSSNDKNVD